MIKQNSEKILQALQIKLSTVRTGRVNASILAGIKVEIPSWGEGFFPLEQLATINNPQSNILVITPFDKSTLSKIEKAVQNSDLNVNPNNNGVGISLNFPPLTTEAREEYVKLVKKHGEESKVAIRNLRKDAFASFKKQKDNNEISEDELRNLEKNAQKEIDQIVEKIDLIVKTKQEELMKV